MKPKEFDVLLQQKFEQNDFEYNPANWALLEEKLDGRAKKRGAILGWFAPLIGVAASIAVALGFSPVWHSGTGKPQHNGYTSLQQPQAANTAVAPAVTVASANSTHATQRTFAAATRNNGTRHVVTTAVTNNATTTNTSIVYNDNNETTDGILTAPANAATSFNFADSLVAFKKKKTLVRTQAMYTFKEDVAINKPARTSIIISGGVNFGNQTSGYSVGASARRMVSDKVYVEGDIAFTGATNTQQIKYLDNSAQGGAFSGSSVAGGGFAAKNTLTSKSSSVDNSATDITGTVPGTVKTANKQYNLYYAQVTPTVGYKIMKRMSVGIGPDFQKMLVDNRPEASTVDRGNIKEAPSFDIGFMGKTEFAFTNSIRAAVYYREGINNVVTPTNKYIDRSYLQVQLKCSILNK